MSLSYITYHTMAHEVDELVNDTCNSMVSYVKREDEKIVHVAKMETRYA